MKDRSPATSASFLTPCTLAGGGALGTDGSTEDPAWQFLRTWRGIPRSAVLTATETSLRRSKTARWRTNFTLRTKCALHQSTPCQHLTSRRNIRAPHTILCRLLWTASEATAYFTSKGQVRPDPAAVATRTASDKPTAEERTGPKTAIRDFWVLICCPCDGGLVSMWLDKRDKRREERARAARGGGGPTPYDGI